MLRALLPFTLRCRRRERKVTVQILERLESGVIWQLALRQNPRRGNSGEDGQTEEEPGNRATKCGGHSHSLPRKLRFRQERRPEDRTRRSADHRKLHSL